MGISMRGEFILLGTVEEGKAPQNMTSELDFELILVLNESPGAGSKVSPFCTQ